MSKIVFALSLSFGAASGVQAFTIEKWTLGMSEAALKKQGLNGCGHHPRSKGLFRCVADSSFMGVSQVYISVNSSTGRLVEIDYWIEKSDNDRIEDIYRILGLKKCAVRDHAIDPILWLDGCFESPDRMRVISFTPTLRDDYRGADDFVRKKYWLVHASYSPVTVQRQRAAIREKLEREAALQRFNSAR
ncbi:hypothetical protein [Cupriavidus necator]|uniref:hypothetical protein n=1 Tax=Cupriavidus necator TaxID=106590 RepID=UPI0012D30F24|nr:hypothetical protein [Cupriavidus necator]